MSCPNENCTPGCGCSNCCPPPVPPTPPIPPTCIGTDCEELYDAGCVNYTGPDISCFGITTNMNLNSIIQNIAQTLCACADAGATCINPLSLFIQRSLYIYHSLNNVTPNIISYGDLVLDMLDKGMLLKKCNTCCPDAIAYGLFFDDDQYNTDFINILQTIAAEDPILAACVNCASGGFTQCSKDFFTAAEVSPYPTTEFGTINGVSGLCTILSELQGQPASLILSFIVAVADSGIIVSCDIENGDVFIGNNKSYIYYVSKIGYPFV